MNNVAAAVSIASPNFAIESVLEKKIMQDVNVNL